MGRQTKKISTKAVKGMRDFFPAEMQLRNWLFGLWRDVSKSYGFVEYDNSPVESEALYIRKAGDEITDQLYNFADKGQRRVALRPEMTPSLARMVMAQSKTLRLPLRWFSIPQCFRYERMQKGRMREHFQWNMDIIGLSSVAAEAELMSAQATLFQRMGLLKDNENPTVIFKVSNRKVLESFLLSEGLSQESFAKVCVIIDKKDKIGSEATLRLLNDSGISNELAERILDLLTITDLERLEALLGADNPGVQDLKKLVEYAKNMQFAHLLRIDLSVVRGLSYYTGIVWEVFDNDGLVPRSIAGGGRYDNLLSTLGGPHLPMVGFGMGDVVLPLILREKGLLPTLTSGIEEIIFPMSESLFGAAQQIATQLRKKGKNVEIDYTLKRFKHVIRAAEDKKANRLWILGESEMAEGHVKVRSLDGSRKEELYPINEWLQPS